MRAAWMLVAVLLTTGCFGGGGTDEAPPPATSTPPVPTSGGGGAAPGAVLEPAGLRYDAPWWTIGERWTIRFETPEHGTRTTTLVTFANNTHKSDHFWLGTKDRAEALDHVFFDNNPFLGRIHHVMLAPHEDGQHAHMYDWPLEDGAAWSSPVLLGKADLAVRAQERDDGTFLITGEARADGASVTYDYDPELRWFRDIEIVDPDGTIHLKATVTQHQTEGAKGTFHFLRGRDYLDSDGGVTGDEEAFTVEDEGATSWALLLDVTAGPGSRLEVVGPDGETLHAENLLTGGTVDKIMEITEPPAPGEWKLRWLGDVKGTVLVRGIIEYKAAL